MHDQIRNNWPQSSTYGCQPFYIDEKNKPVAIIHELPEPVDSDQSDGGFTIRRRRDDDSPFNLPLNVDKGVVFYKGPMPSPLSATKEDLRQPQPDPQGSASSFGVHTIADGDDDVAICSRWRSDPGECSGGECSAGMPLHSVLHRRA